MNKNQQKLTERAGRTEINTKSRKNRKKRKNRKYQNEQKEHKGQIIQNTIRI